MNGKPRAAAVVPAYNEERTVGPVVAVLVASRAFSDVIVVSDGSTDGTAEAARRAGATIVHEFPANRGKGAAMAHGATHTDAPIICFFDADLRGLTADHVRALLAPVESGRLAMHVGLRDRGRILTALSARLPLVSGERAIRRDIIGSIPDRYLRGFKIEIAFDYYCAANGLPVGATVLSGLTIVRKMQKVGLLRGMRGYAAMWLQVLWAMAEVRLARRRFVQMGTHMDHHHR